MARSVTVPNSPKGTASIYVRLSREAGAENLSRDGMRDDCLALAERMGLEVVGVHVDDGLSGAVRNRPEFLAWLADAREGHADTLITWTVDRVTREGVNATALVFDVLEGKDAVTGEVTRPPVRLVDTRGLDSAGDSASFRFSFVIAAEVARAERERMRDRTKSAKRRLAKAGRFGGGSIPYGYKAVLNPAGPGKVLAIEPAEAAMIREAAAMILSGASLLSVVKWANKEGHKPRRAKMWFRASMHDVFTGTAVTGRVVRTDDTGQRAQVIGNDGEPVRWGAVLDDDTAAAVRVMLAPAPRTKKPGRHPARLLSGLLNCAGCDSTLRVTKASHDLVVYRCTSGYQTGACPGPVTVSAAAIERYVVDGYLAAYGDTPAVVRRRVTEGAAEIEHAEMERERAYAALGKDVTAEAFADLQAAEARVGELRAAPQVVADRLIETGKTVREEFESGDTDRKRDLLGAALAIACVYRGEAGKRFNPSRVLLTWQAPFSRESDLAETYSYGRPVV